MLPPTEVEKKLKKIRQRLLLERWRRLHPNYGKEWQAANREYVTEQKRKYRARKANE
jgi:hypothetical protein